MDLGGLVVNFFCGAECVANALTVGNDAVVLLGLAGLENALAVASMEVHSKSPRDAA